MIQAVVTCVRQLVVTLLCHERGVWSIFPSFKAWFPAKRNAHVASNATGQIERSLHAKNQLYQFIHFDRTPTCDRYADRHRALAITALAQLRAD